MNSQRYYRPSGRFTPVGLGVTLATAMGGIALSALIYGYAIAWIPFVYINILLILGYAVACAGLATAGLNFGKVRNVPIAVALSLFLGFFGVYAAWVVWIFAESSQEVFIWAPGELKNVITGLAEIGVWSFKGTTPTGWGLYTFWLLEAVSIIGATVYGGYNAVADNPFCEKCECWMESPRVVGTFDNPTDPRSLQTELEAGRTDVIRQLKPNTADDPAYTIAEVEVCDTCSNFQLLSWKHREVSVNKEGETSVKDKKFVNRLVVDPSLVSALEQHWRQGLDSPSETEAPAPPEED